MGDLFKKRCENCFSVVKKDYDMEYEECYYCLFHAKEVDKNDWCPDWEF